MTGFDSWLTETPEDYDDRMEARAIARGNRSEPDDSRWLPQRVLESGYGPDGKGTRYVVRDPLAYLNFD